MLSFHHRRWPAALLARGGLRAVADSRTQPREPDKAGAGQLRSSGPLTGRRRRARRSSSGSEFFNDPDLEGAHRRARSRTTRS